jgi:hypothetical protein
MPTMKKNSFNLPLSERHYESNPGKPAGRLVSTAISEPFTVYNSKRFPGMLESTELSKKFAQQSVRVPKRNEVRAKRGSSKNNSPSKLDSPERDSTPGVTLGGGEDDTEDFIMEGDSD